MKIWINKKFKDDISKEYKDAIIFNMLEENNKSNLKSDIEKLWDAFGNDNLPSINEDLLIISISVFTADKKISRAKTNDAWTRQIELNIPVIEYDKWINVREKLEKLLGFLSGDKWNIHFRKTEYTYRYHTINKKLEILQKDKEKIDYVSLYSGGLDSFCGAIKLLQQGKNTVFVGFREYGHLENRQNQIFKILEKHYPSVYKKLLVFYGMPRCPQDCNGENVNISNENTSRSRSFMFLAGGLAVASQISKNIPVVIPENGFIGINVPLTPSRKGSCSTRTTHPYFIRKLNELLEQVNIHNKVINIYANSTKGEIVDELKDLSAFKEGYDITISCSHPCQARINGKTIPMNCGYCYPCIIRRASLHNANVEDNSYDYNNAVSMTFLNQFPEYTSRASDLRAVLSSVYSFKSSSSTEIENLIIQTGPLEMDEIKVANRVYIKTMEEIISLLKNEGIKNGEEILEYVGLNNEK